MSGLGSTIKPVTEDSKTDNNTVVPSWAYGVIAGGSATIVTAGAVAYHIITKQQRQKNAETDAKALNQQNLVTPRIPEVTSRYSPRPGEKIV